MSMTDLTDDAVAQIAEEAGIDKPRKLSVFLYLRALGNDKTEIAEQMNMNRKTFQRWEKKMQENLTPNLRSELIMNGMASEHQRRHHE